MASLFYKYKGSNWVFLQNGESYVFIKKELTQRFPSGSFGIKTKLTQDSPHARVQTFMKDEVDCIIIEK